MENDKTIKGKQLNACIIYFSPAGTTHKVAKEYCRQLVENNFFVQLINITNDRDLFPKKNFAVFFERIKKHDLIIIGGPIYIDHLHYNVYEILENLPLPDNNVWGKSAAVFTTFGKVSAGIGSAEGAEILSERGRTVLSALEIDASHCIARNFKNKISENLPGDEIIPYISESVKTIRNKMDNKSCRGNDISLLLQQRISNFSDISDEKEVLSKFPKIEFDLEKCISCMECVKNCPVNYLVEVKNNPSCLEEDICIHCTNCLYGCPAGAVIMDIEEKEGFLINLLKRNGIDPKGPSLTRLF